MGKPLINNTDGTFYQLSGNAITGQLQAQFVAKGQTIPLLLQERSSPSTVYEVKIFNGGFIGAFFQAHPASPGSAHVWLDTADPTKFLFLGIESARLVSHLDQPFLPTIVQGQLLPNDGTTPQALQTGGVGTPVTMPLEQPGEMLGQWSLGCGHFVVNMEIFCAQINGVPSALVTCPLDGFVQRIISPYSQLQPEMAGGINDIVFP